ncbi:pyridoxal phosphate-dependent transferase [Suillus clintonianus]|uniref:pyridoxal phosphate-dependent transferase n=1 Tax=Suillus clintonianus TaxID=1904413 RepID=UPI001B878F15|nr:pyridoxal phosphate-dependent transferase [Suillus clintonianus]KAG2134834.1 pyridoxal phosphate-dependent transferase [Suillus clintonianus]
MTAPLSANNHPLGSAVPPFTQHAISVSLPTWADNVGYEEGEKRVVDAMVSGYPRFFIHLSIQKLARICEQKFGVPDEKCILFPSKKIADRCRSFVLDRASLAGTPTHVRLVQYHICPEDTLLPFPQPTVELHIVLFPSDAWPLAKQFWQHTGLGISSRLADYCLSLLQAEPPNSPVPSSPTSPRAPFKALNKHYSVKHTPRSPSFGTALPPSPNPQEVLSKDQSTYLEERYGRNLPVSAGSYAKRALRRRIAGVLVRDNWEDSPQGPCAGAHDVEVGPSHRGVRDVTEDDVYLFSTGMTAIWSAHQLILGARPPAKSVCFGFPYTDTLKVLQKWGPGCHFLGHGLDSDIGVLETIIKQELSENPSAPPIAALFAEFPSNPLLRSPNISVLRALADKYDFLLVIDETIGNLVNVDVLQHADIVVSSLSKIFSGDANAMGGSLILNPQSRHYATLKAYMSSTYEDTYFDEDAVFMERNSRNFKRRIRIIDENTLAVCEYLRSRSISGGTLSSPVIKEVFYPKYITPENYLSCKLPEGGYGGLFSLTFTSTAASQAFFDNMPFQKGPSLGTNFTLANPYTILAHYLELGWAAEYGVEEGLVRISVGMEEREGLLEGFKVALRAAEAAT